MAAAIGQVAYFAVAIAFNVRADDARNASTPLAIALLAAAAPALRLTTA